MTQENPKPRHISLVYSSHTLIDLEEVMEDTGIEFNPMDVIEVQVKWNTAWITLNTGAEIEYEFLNSAEESLDYKRPDRMSLVTEEMLQISQAGYAEPLRPVEPTQFEKTVMPAINALILSRKVNDFEVVNDRLYNKSGQRVRVTQTGIERLIKSITVSD